MRAYDSNDMAVDASMSSVCITRNLAINRCDSNASRKWSYRSSALTVIKPLLENRDLAHNFLELRFGLALVLPGGAVAKYDCERR